MTDDELEQVALSYPEIDDAISTMTQSNKLLFELTSMIAVKIGLMVQIQDLEKVLKNAEADITAKLQEWRSTL